MVVTFRCNECCNLFWSHLFFFPPILKLFICCSPTVPGEPRRVKLEAINSTAITVQWRPPADSVESSPSGGPSTSSSGAGSGGIVRGYRIYYDILSTVPAHIGDVGVDVDDSVTPGGDELKVLNVSGGGSALDAVIGGLLSDTTYWVQVAAYTRKGEGARTKPKKITTRGSGSIYIRIVSGVTKCKSVMLTILYQVHAYHGRIWEVPSPL